MLYGVWCKSWRACDAHVCQKHTHFCAQNVCIVPSLFCSSGGEVSAACSQCSCCSAVRRLSCCCTELNFFFSPEKNLHHSSNSISVSSFFSPLHSKTPTAISHPTVSISSSGKEGEEERHFTFVQPKRISQTQKILRQTTLQTTHRSSCKSTNAPQNVTLLCLPSVTPSQLRDTRRVPDMKLHSTALCTASDSFSPGNQIHR